MLIAPVIKNFLFILHKSFIKNLVLKLSEPSTIKSYLFAIVGAEYILRWLPIGTHEWEKFVKPDDLIEILKKHGLKLASLDGVKFNVIENQWKISSDKSVNYITKFIKN